MDPAQTPFFQLRNEEGIIFLDGAREGLLPTSLLDTSCTVTNGQTQLAKVQELSRELIKSSGWKFESILFHGSASAGLSQIVELICCGEENLFLIDPYLKNSTLRSLPQEENSVEILRRDAQELLKTSSLPGRISQNQVIVCLNHLSSLSGLEERVLEFHRSLKIQREVEGKEQFLIVDGSQGAAMGLAIPSCDAYFISFQELFGFPGGAYLLSPTLCRYLQAKIGKEQDLQNLVESTLPPLFLIQLFRNFMEFQKDLEDGVLCKEFDRDEHVCALQAEFAQEFPKFEGWELHPFDPLLSHGITWFRGPDSVSAKISKELQEYGIIHSFGSLFELNFPLASEYCNFTDGTRCLFRLSFQWYNTSVQVKRVLHLLNLLIPRYQKDA